MKFLVIISSIMFVGSFAFADCGSCGSGSKEEKVSCSKGKHKAHKKHKHGKEHKHGKHKHSKKHTKK